jgi:serine/threonine protein kinase
MVMNTVLRKRYKILGSLGSGAFGDTYLAEDLDLPSKPKCVVKHLRPKNVKPEVLMLARRLFESEAEALYRLSNLSKQIPKLFAHFEENGEFYLVQEFVDGHDLAAEIIPGNPWSEDKIVQLLQQILKVLVVVHQQNIIHRDIKPQNLMRCREDGKIVLIDFGAVKEIKGLAANSEGQVTSTIIIGSSGYMPDEQANSKPKLSSDIYAVGVIGIQALTGKLPKDFQEDRNNGEIIWRNEANVSNKLANVLTKMVRKRFSERYQTASEALQALNSVSPRLSKSTTSWKLPFRQKVLVTTGVGAGILAILVLAPLILLSTKTTENFTQLPCDAKLSSLELNLPKLPDKPDRKFKNNISYYGSSDENNNFSGKGILVFKNGDRYDGDFKNHKRDGCGRFSFIGGNVYEYYIGQYVDDRPNGLGKLRWKNGDEYRGNFKDYECEGEGVFKPANGSSKSGIWHKGNLLGDNISISCNQK